MKKRLYISNIFLITILAAFGMAPILSISAHVLFSIGVFLLVFSIQMIGVWEFYKRKNIQNMIIGIIGAILSMVLISIMLK